MIIHISLWQPMNEADCAFGTLVWRLRAADAAASRPPGKAASRFFPFR
jgi:hypothetical protein